MKHLSCFTLALLSAVLSIAQTTVDVHPYVLFNATGYIKPDGSTTSGNMMSIGKTANRGYLTFDLSTIPAGSVIEAATITLYPAGGSSTTVGQTGLGTITNLGKNTTDLSVVITRQEIENGTIYADKLDWSVSIVNPMVSDLNDAGLSAIQARIGSYFGVGLNPPGTTTNSRNLAGYNTNDLDSKPPVLTITYNTGGSTKPVAGFNSSRQTVYPGEQIAFFDNSGNYPTSYYWDLGDGTTSTLKNPVYAYPTEGAFTIKLRVSNANGSDSVIKTNYINVLPCPPAPVTDFTVDPTTAFTGTALQFTDLTTNPVNVWRWDFGDGTASPTQNPTHTYSASGIYTVKLLTRGGCYSDSLIKESYIRIHDMDARPFADFVYEVDANTVAFWDSSLNSPGFWSWDFDAITNPNMYTSNDENPVFTYPGSGIYTVCLTVSNANGSDTICKQLDIIAEGLPAISEEAISVYPNPADDEVFILSGRFSTGAEISLVNNLGQVFSPRFHAINGGWRINSGDLPPGIYTVRVQDRQSVRISKLRIR